MTLEEMLNLLGQRQSSCQLMVDEMLKIGSPLIVETGCARQENNFNGDGMSTLIWDAVATRTNGRVLSVDINQSNVDFAKSKVSDHTEVFCSDSVSWLQQTERKLFETNTKIDLLYLDSYDFDAHNPHPSSLHHIFELLSIKNALRPGTLVAVDDNWVTDGVQVGKGTYVAQWMQSVGKEMVYQGYQWIWKW